MCERFCAVPVPDPGPLEPDCLIEQRWPELCLEQRRALVPEINRLLNVVQDNIDKAPNFTVIEDQFWPERARLKGYLESIRD